MRSYRPWIKCTLAQKVERWENVLRVLNGLSKHERDKHFRMNVWATKTNCGTVACAAGHCGMDPWFRRRGFTVKPLDDLWPLMPVEPHDFFGKYGYHFIFTGGDDNFRDVVKSVKTHIKDLRKGINTELGFEEF